MFNHITLNIFSYNTSFVGGPPTKEVPKKGLWVLHPWSSSSRRSNILAYKSTRGGANGVEWRLVFSLDSFHLAGITRMSTRK